ncbi:hypothetical protein QN277_013730 [Acacia crassicarpa]|uniref:Uncharacterized protein n=1 Tax=Acacia crassicarpa TaxID=499986 RepID=A0AAE1N3Y7_9FABA|nr:hypothetical protein QN277_013730 [Acacia crassicarpa]
MESIKFKTYPLNHERTNTAHSPIAFHSCKITQIRPPCQSQDSVSDHEDQTKSQNLSASQTCVCGQEGTTSPELVSDSVEKNGREKQKKNGVEVVGSVWIPEIWGQEELLKDWTDCSAFDAPFVPSRIMTARGGCGFFAWHPLLQFASSSRRFAFLFSGLCYISSQVTRQDPMKAST